LSCLGQAFDGMAASGTKYHATLLDAEHSDFGNDGGEAWLDSEAIKELSSGYVTLERK
jgi:hypothetical protein